MTTLEGIIRYWESVLKEHRYLLEPGPLAHIETTITYLKKLQTLWECA